MAEAAPDRRRQSLGLGRATRCSEACQPQAGWMVVRRRWGRPEVKKKGSLLSLNLWLSRLGSRETPIHLYYLPSEITVDDLLCTVDWPSF
jgi:hypothetical protein